MGFGDDLRKFAEKAKGNGDAIVKKIVIDIATELVEKSPVGDAKYWLSPAPKGYTGGRFRANWQLGIGGADSTTSEAIDKTGGSTIAGIVGKIPDDAGGKVYYITNSLPYAKRLEEGWSHRQAPNGMVVITVKEFEPIVRNAVRALGA